MLMLSILGGEATAQDRTASPPEGVPSADTTVTQPSAPRLVISRTRPTGGGVRIRSVHNSRPRLILLPARRQAVADSAGRPLPVPASGLSPADLRALENRLVRRLDERMAQWVALLETRRPSGATPAAPPPAALPSATPPPPLPAASPSPDTLAQTIPPPISTAITPAQVETALLETGLFRALNIHFEVNQSTLLPVSRKTLDAIGEVLQRNPDLRLEIGGHTDSTGPEDYNLRLSQTRAETVRRYLIERFGIAPERLVARGYGESQPIADNATPTGRTLNRRVEFRVIE